VPWARHRPASDIDRDEGADYHPKEAGWTCAVASALAVSSGLVERLPRHRWRRPQPDRRMRCGRGCGGSRRVPGRRCRRAARVVSGVAKMRVDLPDVPGCPAYGAGQAQVVFAQLFARAPRDFSFSDDDVTRPSEGTAFARARVRAASGVAAGPPAA
jgi:hypothetical protein